MNKDQHKVVRSWVWALGGASATLCMAAAAAEPADSTTTIPVDPGIEQEAGDSEAASRATHEARNRIVEEVVVTSQKREQNIQTVPIAIQAFSGDSMAARGIENTQQLGQAVPSLQYTGVGGFQLIYIRGLGTDNFVPSADPSIASYVDGVYMPSGQGATQSLGNIQRVEVLKGPQGTLFGRNATGGAISIVTADPGRITEGSLEVEGGNFADRSVKLNLSGPLGNDFAASLAGALTQRDSYYSGVYFDPQPTEEKAARVKLGYYPTDSLSLVLTGAYTESALTTSLVNNNTAPSTLGSLLTIRAVPDDFVTHNDFDPASEQQHKLLYGFLNWKLAFVDLKLIGSTQSNMDGGALDFDGSSLPIAAFSTTRQFSRQQTAELQLISNEGSWLAEDLEWVAGLYYYHSKAGFDPAQLRAAPNALKSGAAALGIAVPPGLQRIVDLLPVSNTPLDLQGATLNFTGILGTESNSAYAQGTYSFTDWLDLTLGGRYQREKRFLVESTTALLDPTGGTDDITLIPFPLDSAIASTFSPKAVLSFNVDPGLVYASYSVGYKSGTYNIVNIYTVPNYIKPEKVATYELGAKLDLLDGQLRLNGALFYNDIQNLQSGFVSLLTGGAISFVTVPTARTRGAEFDALLSPMPEANPGLAITANAAYVDAKYTDFPNGSGFDPATGIFRNGLDLSGNRIVRTPKWSGSLGVSQSVEMPQGSLEAAVDGYFNSGFFYDAYNQVEEDAYTLLNARLSYLHDPWNLRLTLFAKNLLDRRYHITRLQTDFGISDTLAPPREYGLRLHWDF